MSTETKLALKKDVGLRQGKAAFLPLSTLVNKKVSTNVYHVIS